ncbi:unnamed protein product [Caenorhabditis sp. 36 PRJEB53466]|nr:unnamed protein product [Caenorhabditis sp. 36 PRJEB53466]
MDRKRGVNALPHKGQVVLLMDEGMPRNYWKLGRVLEVITAADGVIREIKLQTIVDTKTAEKTSVLRRAINQVVPLQLDDTDEDIEVQSKKDDEGKSAITESKPGKRYALRERKPVDYTEEKVQSVTTRSMIPTKAMMMAILTLLNTVLRIRGDFESFEACVRDYCTSYSRFKWKKEDHTDIWIPPTMKQHKHHGTIKLYDGSVMKVIELDCPGVEFCESIDCILCWSLILNPECHIYFAIIEFGSILFGLLMIIHVTCNVPITLGAPIKMYAKGLKTVTLCGCWSIALAIRKCRGRRRRQSKWRELIVVLIVVLLTLGKLTNGCQEIDVMSQFQEICTEDKKSCKQVTEQVIDLNNARREGCLRLQDNRTTIRDIRIQLQEVQLQCTKETITYTQDVELKVESSKRCPHMGSCTADKCGKIKTDDNLPELKAVAEYVGNTRCSESCGGAGCGCFYLSSGCLFFKIYAKPGAEAPIEVFKCLEYTPMAKILITMAYLNSRKNGETMKEFILPIGTTATLQDVTVSVNMIVTPPAEVLNTWFVKRGNETAVWPQNQVPSLRCEEGLKNCTLQEQCNCLAAEQKMICQFKEDEFQEVFRSPEKHFPVHEGHWKMKMKNERVWAKTNSVSATQITIKMEKKWKTTVVKSMEVCTIGSAEATVTGTLRFTGSIWTSLWRVVASNATLYDEINMPDVGHIISSYLNYLKTLGMVIAMVCGAVALIVYAPEIKVFLRIISLGRMEDCVSRAAEKLIKDTVREIKRLKEDGRRQKGEVYDHIREKDWIVLAITKSCRIEEESSLYTQLNGCKTNLGFAANSFMMTADKMKQKMDTARKIAELGIITWSYFVEQLEEVHIRWEAEEEEIELTKRDITTVGLEIGKVLEDAWKQIDDIVFVPNMKPTGPLGQQEDIDKEGRKRELHQSEDKPASKRQRMGKEEDFSIRRIVPNGRFGNERYRWVFCSMMHASDSCGEVTSVNDRIAKLHADNRCLKCVMVKGRSHNCQNRMTCMYCHRTSHHRSICREPRNDVMEDN